MSMPADVLGGGENDQGGGKAGERGEEGHLAMGRVVVMQWACLQLWGKEGSGVEIRGHAYRCGEKGGRDWRERVCLQTALSNQRCNDVCRLMKGRIAGMPT